MSQTPTRTTEAPELSNVKTFDGDRKSAVQYLNTLNRWAVPVLLIAVFLAISTFAQTTKPYSLAEVTKWLLEKRPKHTLYMAVPGNSIGEATLARIVYVPDGQKRLLIDSILGAAPPEPIELQPDGPAGRKLTGKFDAAVMIVVCGNDFGDDDPCDQYSRIEARPLFGKEIATSDEAKGAYQRYLQAAGQILSPR